MNGVEIAVLVLSIIDAVCCLVCRLPQIIRIYKLKQAEAISISFWSCNILSCLVCITAFSLKLFVLGEITTVIFLSSAIMNLLLNGIVLGQTIYYRKGHHQNGEIIKQ